MEIVTYVGARTFAVADHPCPAPGPGQVQLTVDFVAICGTDRRIYRGELDALVGRTAVMGHEVSARVAATGPAVTGVEVGARVTVLPLIWCNSCAACRSGQRHLCQRLSVLGVHYPGGMQRSWNVPADLVVPLPESLSAEAAALVEPAAVAVHALRQAPVAAGSRVLVVDGGAVGLFLALFAMSAGATVAVLDAHRHRRIVGMSAGLQMFNPADDGVGSAVHAWTGAAGVDTAYEVSGEAQGVATAVEALANRGRLVLVGGHLEPGQVDFDRIVRSELSVVGSSRYEREDFVRAGELLADPDFPVALFITATEPVSRVAEAFTALDEGDAMRILVDLRPGA